MDQYADELYGDPRYTERDYEIAFRQLQRTRLSKLSREQSTDLFQVWRDHYRARLEAKEIAQRARFAGLCAERDVLFAERASSPPEQHAALTARLAEIGRELAELQPKFPAAPLGDWG
jgi:hypothetical protein